MDTSDPAVELAAPDITPHAGNAGVSWYTSLAGPEPGPHVLVNALVHGNELCGAIAVDRLIRQGPRPRRGTLTLGFANVAAFRGFDPASPAASRQVDEDFNRIWSPEILDGSRRSVELDRARELRPLIDRIDALLDLHSMQYATPPLALAGPTDKGLAFALAVGFPGIVVRDAGHEGGRRLRDYGGFGDPADGPQALLVECGQHWQAASADVAWEAAIRFLVHCGTIDARHLLAFAPAPAQTVITVTDRVTIRTAAFTFTGPWRGMEVIPRAGTAIAMDGDHPIATPYDDCVLIMPSRRLEPGQTAVRLGRIGGPGA